MSAEAYAEVQLENEHFKVTKWNIEPGAEIPMHRHEYDYVVVPLVNETMHVTNADGSEFAAELTAGQSYTRTAGAEHRIENRAGGQDVVFVEIEKLS